MIAGAFTERSQPGTLTPSGRIIPSPATACGSQFMAIRIQPNEEPIPGYKLIERLGGGGFGEVWKAEAPGGLHKAIKIVHGDLRTGLDDDLRHAEQELKALKRVQAVRHPYLLSLERYDIVE